jgi:hypothetical protein
MRAVTTLPDSAPQSNARRIAELAGADYVGSQLVDEGALQGTLQYFCERVTGTTLALWDLGLTVESLRSRITEARVSFGLAVSA